MHTLKIALIFLALTVPPNWALAAPSQLDSWAAVKANLLTQNCKKRTSIEWLKSYNLIDDELLIKLKTVEPSVLTEPAKDSGFLDFVQVFYPQDLPDSVPMSGAYLECSKQFFGFAEGTEKKKQNASLKAWAECVNNDEEPTPFQRVLGKCLGQLKKN